MEVSPRIDPLWFERRAVRGVVLMTLADIAFKPLLLEWLSHVGRLGYGDHASVVALSAELSDQLRAAGHASYLLPRNKTDFRRAYMPLRWRIMAQLNHHGLDVLCSDADAFWLRDPLPPLLHAMRNRAPGIAAGRGGFPGELKALWGATLCNGLVFIRGRLAPQFWSATLDFRGSDQRGLNALLNRSALRWTSTSRLQYASSARVDYARVPLFGFTVALMPQETFRRLCFRGDTPEPGVVVRHCVGKKTQAEAVQHVVAKGAAKLRAYLQRRRVAIPDAARENASRLAVLAWREMQRDVERR